MGRWSLMSSTVKAMQNTNQPINKIEQIFNKEPNRRDACVVKMDGLKVDYSRHWLPQDELKAKQQKLDNSGIKDFLNSIWQGEHVNKSEDRPVYHLLYRTFDGINLSPEMKAVWNQIQTDFKRLSDLHEQIKSGSLKGASGKTIKNCVHVGIGGSTLGPVLMNDVFSAFQKSVLNIHFLANLDPIEWSLIERDLDLEETIFVVASKSFSTPETMENAKLAMSALNDIYGNDKGMSQIYAVTSSKARAKDLSVPEENIFEIHEGINGRFSFWSPISMAMSLGYGPEMMKEFFEGGAVVDTYMKQAEDVSQTIPAITAILGDYYRNEEGILAHAVVPYATKYARLPECLQQLDMESNGKSFTNEGARATCATGPLIFGQYGTMAQHAFMQWLHQGTDPIPADFVAFKDFGVDFGTHKDQLLSHAIAQVEALAFGQENKQEVARHFDGNRPSSLFVFDKFSVQNLGVLLALYEYKVFIQGFMWGINSFDQFGVELGKTLSKELFDDIKSGAHSSPALKIIQD